MTNQELGINFTAVTNRNDDDEKNEDGSDKWTIKEKKTQVKV